LNHAPERLERAPAVYFILITVALDTMGAGLLIPVLPGLIAHLTGEGLTRAAVYGGSMAALFAAMQFFAAPLLGSLSDHLGRRPVLLLSLAAFGVSYLLMAFASSLLWLYLSQACAGLFGATTATAGAYLADITPEQQRAHRFGLTGAAFGTGIIIGPMLGGLLTGIGPRVPFYCAAGLALVNVIYGALVLPESLPLAHRRPFAWARSHVLGAINALRPLPIVFPVLGAVLLIRIALQTIPATWPYFSMQRFGWNERDVGYSLGLYGLFSIVGQGLLVGLLTRRFGPKGTVIFGLLMAIAGFIGFTLAFNGVVAIAFVVPSALGFMSGPSMTGLMSMHTPSGQQGELQGAIASIGSVAMMLTPPMMTGIYSHFASPGSARYFPAAPYAAAALLSVASLALFIIAMKRSESRT